MVEARAGSLSRRLTTFAGTDGGGDGLTWSPDGTLLAYGQGSEPKFNFHSLNRLAVVGVKGGAPRLLTESLDRSVSGACFSSDGKSLFFTVADDRTVYLARVPTAGGKIERVVGGQRVVGQPSLAKDRIVVTSGTSTEPTELYAVEGRTLRRLTAHNDSVVAELQLQSAEEIAFKSKDGTEIHGLLTKPLGYVAGRRYPTLVRLHGGPTAQDAHSFSFERQMFAANGYAVVNVNYRGSSGRGAQFQEAIFADWGNKEVRTCSPASDYVVAQGIADPDARHRRVELRWHPDRLRHRERHPLQGGDQRGRQRQPLSMYGHDQYTFLYDNEFGPPWKNADLWIKFSYPFFKADRIRRRRCSSAGKATSTCRSSAASRCIRR